MLLDFEPVPNTHVVIGGGVATAFKIADSAQMFRIMSDTLYRDKIMAVAREVLCNANDSHIAGMIADKAIKVTINDNSLTFQDFGAGIPHADFEDIYTTYFLSQKSGDDEQTGGFGLGCKAPFSITDHFTVSNARDGRKGIYALTIAEDTGKPMCRLMTSFESTETGVTVQIPIKTSQVSSFNFAIETVAYNGGMYVEINGELVNRRDNAALIANGYGLFFSDKYRTRQIFALYGSVLYPIEEDRAIDDLLNKIKDSLPSGFDLILSFPPRSVRPKPDREGLSYSESTIAAVMKALKRFKVEVVDRLPGGKRKIQRALMTQVNRNSVAALGPGGYKPSLKEATNRRDAISLIAARQAVSGQTTKSWLKAFVAVNRDHGGSLRKIINSGQFSAYDTTRNVWHYHIRRLVRALGVDRVRKIEVGRLVYNHRGSDRIGFATVDHAVPSFDAPDTIFIVGNRKIDVREKRESLFSRKPIFCLIDPKIRQAEFDQIAISLAYFGFEPEFHPAPEAAPRKKRVTRQATLHIPISYKLNSSFGAYKAPAPELFEPDVWLPIHANSTRDYNLDTNMVNRIERLKLRVAIAIEKSDTTTLVKQNVPLLEEWLAAKLTLRLGLRPVQERYLRDLSIPVDNYKYRCWNELSDADYETLCLALNKPYSTEADDDVGLDLWRLARDLIENSRFLKNPKLSTMNPLHSRWKDAKQTLLTLFPNDSFCRELDPLTIDAIAPLVQLGKWSSISRWLKADKTGFLHVLKALRTIPGATSLTTKDDEADE